MDSTPTSLIQQTPALPEQRLYEPFGAARKLWWTDAPEVLVSGPAGTGKSRACLEKLHYQAERYPGMRGLILRKTRESLTESALVTFEEKVLPAFHPALDGPQRSSRRVYRYPNGSEIIVAGLRQGGRNETQRVMSTEYDMIYAQEAIELSEDDWEKATTRLRNGRTPYGQMIGDTNPDRPTHWLKRRCDAGLTQLLESRHEDNPTIWDRSTGTYTDAGRKYLAVLDALTGPRHQRLRRGRWVQAEGVVYDGWDAALHLVDRFRIPEDWPRYLAIDFGFTNPLVVQWWAKDPDGRLYLYREFYATGWLVEDAAKEMKKRSTGEPRPRAIVCDHDAEDRATLEKHLGMKTTPAIKDISPGIQAVAGRLKAAGDGKPRLYLLHDTLVARDPVLVEKKRPTCTSEEIDGYVWDAGGGRKKGEVPVAEDNHGCDAMRYLVYWLERSPGASRLTVGGRAAAPAGMFGRQERE